ncbi:MAG TPA: C40 family peptidase [Gaiellaceae bacterium]|nr:C40 family peptidase [Gaiellaceae bacterium]
MRTTPLVGAGAALAVGALAVAAAGSSAAPPPALQAKQRQAASVLAQVNALDVRFGKVVDSWDGARVQLAGVEQRLAANRVELRRAQRQSRIADRRRAARLVTIYEGEHPDIVQVLAGVSRLSDVIDAVEVAQAVTASDRRLADDARRSKERLAALQLRWRATELTRRATLADLGHERARIGSMLSERRRLLSSVRSQVAAMQAKEAERQRELAAAARARLARQQEELRRQAAARAAAARKAAETATVAATTTAAATTSTVATTTSPATVTVAPAPSTTAATTTAAAPPPAVPAGAGHPEAATIALRYLGIPYRWGGASPATGFDCSGLVMYVYAQLGIQLPHYAAAQYGYGAPVARDQLQPGDLVFFDGLSHVGIYIGGGQMVHAPQTGDVVKISPIDRLGYVGARRI